MNKNQALYKFWSSFNIPAYEVNSVPDDATLPYITYTDQIGYMGDNNYLTASVWDFSNTNSWGYVIDKADEIGRYLGDGGKTLRYDDGLMWVRRGTPFGQRMNEPSDERIKRMLINVQIEFISN